MNAPSPWSAPHRVGVPRIPLEHMRHDPAATEAALRAHVDEQDIRENLERAERPAVLPLWAVYLALAILTPFAVAGIMGMAS